jgi:hypothetical protein
MHTAKQVLAAQAESGPLLLQLQHQQATHVQQQ